jgi:hypothetical protein
MNFDLSDEEISLIKKALEVQLKAYRDKFLESYQGKEHLVHATAEDPHGIDFVASNMMRKYQKLLNKFKELQN